MRVILICDNVNSWIIPYLKKAETKLKDLKHNVEVVYSYKDIKKGDLAFFLSCENIASEEILNLNKKNLVVHESDLPKGKGWSPLTWQILEGKNQIPITLFEAANKVDSGDIYMQDEIVLSGYELLPEIKNLQGEATIELILKFVELYSNIEGVKQIGESTFYAKRTPKDSELDVNKTINEQFNLLRVVDNERYPAYFIKGNYKYYLRIEREEL